jgi:hypothetical protein
MTRNVRSLIVAAVASAPLLLARPALAGPPLLCHPFDIGAAHSLPMGRAGWSAIDPTYDVQRLVGDTLAILSPEAPVTVRMETIRRATIYASKNPGIAAALLSALQERAAHPDVESAALAMFDFGYLVETYREGTYALAMRSPAIDKIDGYQIVLKAKALQNDDRTMEQAASLIVDGLPKRSEVK